MTEKTLTEKILTMIGDSPSVFHAVKNITDGLTTSGFERLREREAFTVRPGGAYFVTRNSSAVLAFKVPEGKVASVHICASHADSPTFKVKPDPETTAAGCVRLNVEKYGGMLTSTWYDRPLTVAGRVFISRENGIEQKLVYVDRDLLIIPSLAIHMDRESNNKNFSNVQTDMLPLFAEGEARGRFAELVAEAAGCEAEEILGMDLFLANRQKPVIFGAENEYIAGPRLDDLMCAYGTLEGFLAAGSADGVLQVYAAFDNEEVGSRTKQGAESDFLAVTLARVAECLAMSAGELSRALSSGLMLSADNAHAAHPNHVDKADPVLRPAMNGGVVLKYHANQKYTTDGRSEAYVTAICRRHDIPLQRFVNRSDMAGGSTLGNISNTQISMDTADIGLAQLAMHSSYETAGARDLGYLAELARAFYEEKLPEIAD